MTTDGQFLYVYLSLMLCLFSLLLLMSVPAVPFPSPSVSDEGEIELLGDHMPVLLELPYEIFEPDQITVEQIDRYRAGRCVNTEDSLTSELLQDHLAIAQEVVGDDAAVEVE